MNKNNKARLSGKGYELLGSIVGAILIACVLAIVIAGTIALVNWIL